MLLTTGQAMNLPRERVTLRDEASARILIKAGLKEYYTFLNTPENHGFPGVLGTFIQDKGGPVKTIGAVAGQLLEPARITELFNECLMELADDPSFEHLKREGDGAYDHLRGRNVSYLYLLWCPRSDASVNMSGLVTQQGCSCPLAFQRLSDV